MKRFIIKVECEYYVEVEAETAEAALENAVAADYDVGDLQNFYYSVDSSEDIEDNEELDERDEEE